MADDDADDKTQDDADETEETTEDDKAGDDSDDDDDDSGDTEDDKGAKKDPELVKAIKARDRAKNEARRLRAELDKSKKPDDDEPDPVAEANVKIVRTAAHGILRGLGIEDKDDRVAVLDLLRLDDVTVDKDGADEDEIEERIENLRSILGAQRKTTARVPRTVKGNRETKETNSDPDKKRYARILGR